MPEIENLTVNELEEVVIIVVEALEELVTVVGKHQDSIRNLAKATDILMRRVEDLEARYSPIGSI